MDTNRGIKLSLAWDWPRRCLVSDRLYFLLVFASHKFAVLGAGIDYVLVIATPLEIVLLGVSLNAGANEGFRLFETPYSTTADGVSMTTIVGTPGGRIFMGGSNGNIYELCYQAEEGWFSRKCYKVNHSSSLGYLLPSVLRFGGEDPCLSLTLDNDRNLLYSLSAGGAIEAIHLGANGKEFRQFAHKSDICRAAAQLSQSAASKGCRIVSIHSLSSAESRRWQLVAVTSSGCRLYFSVYPRDTATASLSPGATSFSQQVPTTLDLVHVRLPPTDLASSEDEIHTAIYSDGLLLAARISNEEKDAVIGTGPDYHSRTRVGFAGMIEL